MPLQLCQCFKASVDCGSVHIVGLVEQQSKSRIERNHVSRLTLGFCRLHKFQLPARNGPYKLRIKPSKVANLFAVGPSRLKIGRKPTPSFLPFDNRIALPVDAIDRRIRADERIVPRIRDNGGKEFLFTGNLPWFKRAMVADVAQRVSQF